MRYIFYFLIVISHFAIIPSISDTTKNDSVFVPSKKWQIVKKGTPIPAGLHVRYDFQTGITEAKLMDKEEEENSKDDANKSQSNSLTIHSDKTWINEDTDVKRDEQVKINFNELKAILKEMNSGEPDVLLQSKDEKYQPERRKKFKSYSQLKQDLETLNLNISTDSEVLNSLFNEFEPYKETVISENLDSLKIQDILEILNNLEYLIHQIDNAKIFSEMGGMSKIISPCLNSSNAEVKAEALKLLGAAVQSNPKVQLKALENDFVKKLLHMLTINNKIEVKSRCLFALGALVRHFPAAQKALINNGGLEIFGKILADGDFSIQIRIMNLINDLTIERQNLHNVHNEKQKMKLKEYDLTNFEYKLSMHKYCQNFVDLMIRSLKVNSEINDFLKTIYESIIILSAICKNEFMDKKEVLAREMLTIYLDSSNINEDNVNMYNYHKKLMKKFQNIINEKLHDEL